MSYLCQVQIKQEITYSFGGDIFGGAQGLLLVLHSGITLGRPYGKPEVSPELTAWKATCSGPSKADKHENILPHI